MLITSGCAGQFELDLPDEHPALENAQNAPIEPAPDPNDQRYPIALDKDDGGPSGETTP